MAFYSHDNILFNSFIKYKDLTYISILQVLHVPWSLLQTKTFIHQGHIFLTTDQIQPFTQPRNQKRKRCGGEGRGGVGDWDTVAHFPDDVKRTSPFLVTYANRSNNLVDRYMLPIFLPCKPNSYLYHQTAVTYSVVVVVKRPLTVGRFTTIDAAL